MPPPRSRRLRRLERPDTAGGGSLPALHAYLIGTALVNFPLASVIISSLVTGIALAGVYFLVRGRRRAEQEAAAAAAQG